LSVDISDLEEGGTKIRAREKSYKQIEDWQREQKTYFTCQLEAGGSKKKLIRGQREV